MNAGVICVYLNGPNPDIKIEAGKVSIFLARKRSLLMTIFCKKQIVRIREVSISFAVPSHSRLVDP